MEKGYAVITGASSGLGAEFARQLSQQGYKLVLAARREDRLKELQSELRTESILITADLRDRDQCEELFRRMEGLDVEIFINNAGFGDCDLFCESDMKKELDMIDVNVIAVHILSKLAIQYFRKHGDKGSLLNVASSAGLFPAGPYMATYYATKAYVASLSQAVACELKQEKSGITVSALCPGPVDTEFNDVAQVRFSMKGISAQYCVKTALQGMAAGKRLIVPTIYMKLALFGTRFLPRKAVVALNAKMQNRKRG